MQSSREDQLQQPVVLGTVAKKRIEVDNTLFRNSFGLAELGWWPRAQRLPSIRGASF